MANKKVHTIYDRVAKRCLSVSKRGTLMLINGTDSYHIEFQMTEDNEIILRVFEYGFGHAVKNRDDGSMVLRFPCPIIIYLYENGGAPDELELLIEFGDQGIFRYKVPIVRYQEIDGEELNRRKLIVLVPFQFLRLRKLLERARTPENIEALKNLIRHDIIEVIELNVSAGNIDAVDGQKLFQMAKQLYGHIYGGYAEMEEYGVDEMMEDYLILDADIQEKRHRDELQAERQELNALTLWLLSQNRTEDLKHAAQDEAYQETLLKEYRKLKK